MAIFEEIRDKLIVNPENGEAYAELGDYYSGNVNQAYLCYEHAYHRSEGKLKDDLKRKMDACRESEDFKVVPVSFVILSYNAKTIMQECLNAIRSTCDDGSYEVIVIDNVSTDGVREWLQEQDDIKLALNEKNSGFAAGCNQGAKLAGLSNDILLLNNDAIVTPHAVFYLRLGLYAKDRIGAVGPVSNTAIREQKYDLVERSKEEWMQLANHINIPSEHYEQVQHWLQGHALLLKRRVWDEIGGLDTNFGFGGHEDDEYGIRMNANGYLTVCCRNSFVFHYGSTSMNTKPVEFCVSLERNRAYLSKKWGFDWEAYRPTHFRSIDRINVSKMDAIKVLEINGGFSNELNIVKYRYPNAEVYAIEKNEKIAHIASNYLNVICDDIETMNIPFEMHSFDYIILNKVVEYLLDPQKTLEKIRPYLKEKGHILVSADNVCHIRVIKELVKGCFLNASESWVWQQKKHLYTTNDLTSLVNKSGYIVDTWTFLYEGNALNSEERELLDAILKMPWAGKENDYIHSGCLIEAHVG